MAEQPNNQQGTEEQTKPRRVRRVREGVVTSDKADKTIRVRLETTVKHPRYGKYVRRRTIVHAHDERNEAREGDVVSIMESRSYSKSKNWRLVKVLRSVGGPVDVLGELETP